MNRIEKRISGTRPGAPVCNPGKPNSNVGMLGGTSYLYQRPNKKMSQSISRNNTKRVNGVAILKNQGDRLKRLENKLEQIEKNQAITSSNIDLINDKTTTKIQLMNGSYKKQMIVMKNYIKELELKLMHSMEPYRQVLCMLLTILRQLEQQEQDLLRLGFLEIQRDYRKSLYA